MSKIRIVFWLCVTLPLTAFGQAVPVPSHPPDGATDQPTTVTLRWVPVLLATSYDVHVSTYSDFRTLTKELGVSSTSAQISGLSDGTTYYWRVRAIVTLVPGLWSATASFTTARPEPQIPDAPALSSPANGATQQPLALNLTWNTASGASSYTVQVSTSSSFSSVIVDQSGLTASTREIKGLSPGTTYHWRVSAQNSAGSSDWSAVWKFTTQISTPSAPTLASPANGATGQPTSLTLDWNSASGAESYLLQVSTDGSFSSIVVDQSGLTATSREATGLAAGTKHYWRVRGQNSAGPGSWSQTWSFTTRMNPPPAPALLSPPNGAANQPVTLTLAWSTVSSAATYQVQVATNSSFSSPVLDESSLTETSHEVTSLSPGTMHYWRVRAGNEGGNGGWSDVWSFTTADTDSAGTYRLSTTIDFPSYQNLSDYSPADYKIIGLPGASNSPLGSMLPGAAGRDWQAYWDNGQETEYWLVYDGGPTFVFSVGRAFWILKRGPWTIDASVPAPATNANGEVEIPLHEGWNLITCPYPAPVYWPEVQQLNSINEPLYRYIDGRYANAGYLEPYVGYYLFNENDSTTLLIPPKGSPGPPNRGIAQGFSGSAGWRVTVAATNGTAVDDLLIFGSEGNATAGKDPVDVHKPRPVAGFGSYFSRPDWNPRHSSFASDIRPPVTGQERWQFHIESTQPSTVSLSFRDAEDIPAHLGAMLIDEQSGVVTDVKGAGQYSFSTQGGIRAFTILIGPAEEIAEAAGRIALPSSFSLGRNFPNPFNPTTMIPFELPTASDVRITVHDMLGRQVRVLMDENLREGRYQVTWDGRDNAGRTVSSGVYICRMSAGNGPGLTTVMVLAK